ncbi:MAG: GHKL domain-containing protein [Planctomycetales bacterium]|nr:GHKL domain-containing protein [Planctomycetales bacterium]
MAQITQQTGNLRAPVGITGEQVSALGVALLRIDQHGDIVAANSPAVELLRLDDAAASHSFADFIGRHSVWAEIVAALRGRSQWQSTVAFRLPDKKDFVAELRATPVGANGEVTVMVLPTADGHQHPERAEWAQRQALSHASRLQIMGELIGAIAHEMTQPLGAISNFASACRTRFVQGLAADGSAQLDAKTAAQFNKWLDAVIDQTHRAGSIIDRLRRFSKRSAPHRSTFDLNQVLEESIQLHITDAYNEQVKLRARLQPGAPLVIIDEVQLHQVMANLIRNAFEATESNADERWVVIQSRIDDTKVTVTVEDNGIGVSQDLGDIYEPFATSRPDRMGVGLAIARSIIEAHHGRLWHENNANGGVSFHFSLPLVAAKEQPGR